MNSTIGCYNTDVPLWAAFFKSYPNENCTYLGDSSGCSVHIMGEIRAVFPSTKAAMDCMNTARKQADDSK